MAEQDPLAELYLQRHPREAAAVLEGLDIADVAGLLDTVADDRATDVLSLLPPAFAVACLETTDAAKAAGYLGNMSRRAAAAVLRQMAVAHRTALLQAMSTPTRMQLEVILHQPSHRVGAWIDSKVTMVEQGTTAATARQRLSRVETPVGEIYVVDTAQRLQGIVAVSRLLTLADDRPVEAAMEPPRSVLRGNATTEGALEDAAWEEVDTLPVVDRDGKLIGSIRHAALRHALRQQQAAEAGKGGGEYLSLANTVYVGLAEVLATSIAKAQAGTGTPHHDRESPR